MALQEISDRLEIQALLTRYAHAIDNRDWEALHDVFTEDAVIDYSAFGVPPGDLSSTKEFLRTALGSHTGYCHLLGQSDISVSGDHATASTPCHNPMVHEDADGREHVYVCGLWYHDTLVRTPAGWRIAERTEEKCYLKQL